MPGGRRAWERAELLEPRIVGREPEFVSDGGGLPFSPGLLSGPAPALDPADPAVAALLARLRGERPGLRLPWRRRGSEGVAGTATVAAPDPGANTELAGWRLLARTDDEAVFGKGRPPLLLTVAARRDGRGGGWSIFAVTRERPQRASHEGVRASSWRLEPEDEPGPGATELRILVTEQRRSGGRYANGRFLTPDLHLGREELILTMFVSPTRSMGVQGPNPETAVRIALPEPVGARVLLDGAVYEPLDGQRPSV